jgi:ech hydrogenase subunit A
VVDNIAMTMFLVINIVGGIIIIYSLEYIKTENFSNFKKNSFISLLFLFLGVMNLLVSANSLEIFFFVLNSQHFFHICLSGIDLIARQKKML